jgi:ribosomal protein S2
MGGYITNYDEMMKKYEKYVNDSKTNVQRELREKEVEQLLKSIENYENYMKEYRDASND